MSAPYRPWPTRPPDGPVSALPLAMLACAVLAPPAIVAWLGGALALRVVPRVRRWHLWAAGLTLTAASVAAGGPQAAVERHFWLVSTAAALWLRTGSLDGLVGMLAGGLVRMVPLGVAAGLGAAAVNRPSGELATPETRAREKTARRELAVRRKAGRLVAAPGEPAALGVSLGGDLVRWRRGRYVVLPDDVARKPRLVLGAPGGGKSVYLCREAFLAGLAGRRLVVLDGKGDREFANAVVSAYAAGCRAAGRMYPSVLRFPDEPLDAWRGGARGVVNRLLGCWAFSDRGEYYEQVASAVLRLALSAPPEPSSSRELLARMDVAELKRLWKDSREESVLVAAAEKDMAGVVLRVGNLMASMGGHLDGERSFEDADLTVVSLPTMAEPHDADAVFRILLADLGHWAVHRKPPVERGLVVVDEFSAVSGGRMAAIHLTERGRGAGVPVVLAAQSRRSLGSEEEADRLVGAAVALVLFGSPEPEELVRVAGTVLGPDAVYQTEGGQATGRASVTMRASARLDANLVRELRPGECWIVSGGRAEKTLIIPPGRPAEAEEQVLDEVRVLAPPPGVALSRPDGFPVVRAPEAKGPWL